MKLTGLILIACVLAVSMGCRQASVEAPAPVAAVIPHELEAHGETRIDDYYWLRERENPAVIEYLEEENAYTKAVMAPTEDLQEALFEEIVARIEPNDESVPYLLDGYYRATRYEEGGEYPVYCRREAVLPAPEEVVLDVNALADGHAFCSVRGVQASRDGKVLAYALDTVGRRKYTMRFKDLMTGADLPDQISKVTGNIAWANDNLTVFYTRQDPVTLRSYQVYRHVLGTDADQDVLVYEEADETFSVSISRARSKRYIFIESEQTLSDEWRFIDADSPEGEPRIVQPRQRGLEYQVDHLGDNFFIRTNLGAQNFRLMVASVDDPGVENWDEVIAHREDVYLSGFDVFRSYLVVSERIDGLRSIRVIDWHGGEHVVDFDEAAYTMWVDENPEVDTDVLRLGYTSLTTPESIYDYDMNTRELTLLKQDTVGGGYDPAEYTTERLMVAASDGVQVPVSLAYRNDMERDGSNPLLLYAYGSYGYSRDPRFASDRLSLLDRGFVYAIAHVRGGQEMGRQWYEDGKLLKKKNTFTDFIDCGRALVELRYTSSDRLFAMGGSAGGLLMGAVSNMAPDLFAGIVAAVPFVDVITTMLDETIPLTTSEFDEWGNPNDKQFFDYMMSYSPYDQVEAKDYPNLLVTTGLHDSQVQYWEPAKWVAKLRTLKTDDNRLVLSTNMDAGHGGASGRYRKHRETALEYAFMLDILGFDH